MKSNLSLWDAVQDYLLHLSESKDPKSCRSTANQVRSAMLRCVALGLGSERENPRAKMSNHESQAAIDFLDRLPVDQVAKVPRALHTGFSQLRASDASQKNYASYIGGFMAWAKAQPWNPGLPQAFEKRCPKMMARGKSRKIANKITHRSGKYKKYALDQKDMSPELLADLKQFEAFLSDPHHPERLTGVPPLKPSSAKAYLKNLRLMLGFRVRHDSDPIEASQIQLSDLVPILSSSVLDDLSRPLQRQLQQQARETFSRWWYGYLAFLADAMESRSPRTTMNKLLALMALAKFLYRKEVLFETDYGSIFVMQVINQLLKQAMHEVGRWRSRKQTVSKFSEKWLDYDPEQETILDAIYRRIVEPLRLELAVRDQYGQYRQPRAIAKSLAHFLLWHRMTTYPARRPGEIRQLKVALFCPVEKPPEVPADGYYFPLLPNQYREVDASGNPTDNCLYRIYSHDSGGQLQGKYMLQICGSKTHEKYGMQEIPIDDEMFEDQTTLYGRYHDYLCGRWVVGGNKHDLRYTWWRSEWYGQRGRWVSKGRQEFNPEVFALPNPEGVGMIVPWGYLFPGPLTGKCMSEANFGRFFSNPAMRLTNKKITPHMLRKVWATWAIEAGLTEREVLAVAYLMGHSTATFHADYARPTSEVQRRFLDGLLRQRAKNRANPPD